jgi:hypothetical protein
MIYVGYMRSRLDACQMRVMMSPPALGDLCSWLACEKAPILGTQLYFIVFFLAGIRNYGPSYRGSFCAADIEDVAGRI